MDMKLMRSFYSLPETIQASFQLFEQEGKSLVCILKYYSFSEIIPSDSGKNYFWIWKSNLYAINIFSTCKSVEK